MTNRVSEVLNNRESGGPSRAKGIKTAVPRHGQRIDLEKNQRKNKPGTAQVGAISKAQK